MVSRTFKDVEMIDFLRHAIGICGEPHPSLLSLLLGTPLVGYLYYKFKKIKK